MNRVELVREWGGLVRLGKLKRMNCGWEGGFEMTEKRENEAEAEAVAAIYGVRVWVLLNQEKIA